MEKSQYTGFDQKNVEPYRAHYSKKALKGERRAVISAQAITRIQQKNGIASLSIPKR